MKKLVALIVSLFLSISSLYSQERKVEGLVFDSNTKQRLTRVYIYNLRTNKGIFNNTKGEFRTSVNPGDTLIAALEGYSVDTATVHNQSTILFFLRPTSIRLKEVIVKDTVRSPDRQRQETEKEYADIYRKGNSRDLLSLGSPSRPGAGLSIDALYSLLSKEGKHARYLQQIIERDYREAIINYRYTQKLIADATGLNGSSLQDFMSQYRPSYYFILQASDYELLAFIKESYQKYRRNPSANRLPPLTSPKQ